MATGKIAETVAVELEQVAGDLEQVASVTRRIDGRVITSLSIGLGVGAVVGFYVGYKYSKRKLRNEIYAEAERDVESIRDLYQQKLIAADNLDKDSVATIVEERGYTPEVEVMEEVPEPQSLRSNVFVTPPEPTLRMPTAAKDKDDDWNWENEYVVREDGTEPYVLHQDEFEANESSCPQVTYVYYVRDDILVDEDDPKTILSNQDRLVGPKALEKFGHGADDYNTVYVLNPNLELEICVHRVMSSWEEEVLGLDPNESG